MIDENNIIYIMISLSAGACAIGGGIVTLVALNSGKYDLLELSIPALALGIILSLAMHTHLESEIKKHIDAQP